MWNRSYTTKDTDGFEVQKGDQVTITFTGKVGAVSRDGLVMIKLPDGSITGYYPNFQAMRKVHPNMANTESTPTT